MSTRSNIAIEHPKTKKVKVIYVHSDGYPYGVGHMLVDNYYNRQLAEELFKYGDASYIDETIDQCSFYARDWDRDEEPAKTYRNEYMYMASMRGDVFIEYIYLFKDNKWHVSTQKMYSTKDGYDGGKFWYHTEFEPVIMNKEYIKYKGKHEKHAEVKMISSLGKMLTGAGFVGDNVLIQGGKAKKSN